MKYSGQITLTTINQSYAGPDIPGDSFLIKALSSNTGIVYVGNDDGSVSATTGYPLSAGESVYIELSNLNSLRFLGSVAGQKVAWLRTEL
jgi:hypothetical protein